MFLFCSLALAPSLMVNSMFCPSSVGCCDLPILCDYLAPKSLFITMKATLLLFCLDWRKDGKQKEMVKI